MDSTHTKKCLARSLKLSVLSRKNCRPWLTIMLAVFAAVAPTAAGRALNQVPSTPNGIEHVLYLAVRSDSASPLRAHESGQTAMAKLIVNLQISAHSQETSFYGVVPATISDFNLAEGSPDQEIWRDGKCHHERGFPKITVTGVNGVVTTGQQKNYVTARWRKLGLFLPGDEVTASKRLTHGTDDIGSFLATRTETKQSRLFVDLKLYILPCDLPADAKQDEKTRE